MELILPNKKYYESYVDAINEYRAHKVTSYDFLDVDEYNIFEQFDNSRIGRNLPEGYVAATYLWLVSDEKFIGEVSIRHELTDFLLCFGGNIGYGIRYSSWNNGLGTLMLSEALKYAKEIIKLNNILITCSDDNIGSARVIEKMVGCYKIKL